MASCECYDFKLKMWSPIKAMTNDRSTFRATIFEDKLLVAGGYKGQCKCAVNLLLKLFNHIADESAIDNSEIYEHHGKEWRTINEVVSQWSPSKVYQTLHSTRSTEMSLNKSKHDLIIIRYLLCKQI